MSEYRANQADCICPPDTVLGRYVVGCPYHVALEMQDGPIVSTKRSAVHVVEFFHAKISVRTPVLKQRDGETFVASQMSTIKCDHNHDTIDAAERCAARLALKHGGIQR